MNELDPTTIGAAGAPAPRSAAIWGVLLLAACAYGPALAGGFTWDDEYVLVLNEALRQPGNLLRFFGDAGTSAVDGRLAVYRPLRTSAFSLAYQAWGLAPLGYHLVNLLLHLGATALVYSVARRLLATEPWALLTAALFAVHPINSEAVAGVVGLGDLLSAAFLLGAMRVHLRVTAPWGRDLWRAAAVAVLFGGALLSKETALVFPLLLAWAEASVLRARRGTGRGFALYLGLLVALGAAFLGLRYAVMGGLNAGAYEGVTLGRTMWMQADVLARYLRLVAFPAGLSIRHAIPVPITFFEPRTLLSVAALATVLAGAVLVRRRAPLVTFGIGWFFLALLPVMNVIPLPGAMMGERFCYVPVIGLLVALAESVRLASGAWRPRSTAVAGAVVLALAAATFSRSLDWRDNLTIFEAAARVAPESNAVRINLAREYGARGQERLARQQLEAAAANTRAYADRYVAVARAAEASGARAEAAAWYRRALGMGTGDQRAIDGLVRLEAPR